MFVGNSAAPASSPVALDHFLSMFVLIIKKSARTGDKREAQKGVRKRDDGKERSFPSSPFGASRLFRAPH